MAAIGDATLDAIGGGGIISFAWQNTGTYNHAAGAR
jgi:hypothetical protein